MGDENSKRSGLRILTVRLSMSGHDHVIQLPAISRQSNASEVAWCDLIFMSGDSCDIAVMSGSGEPRQGS